MGPLIKHFFKALFCLLLFYFLNIRMVAVPWDFDIVTSQYIMKLNSKMDEQHLKIGTYTLNDALQQTVLMQVSVTKCAASIIKDTKE